MAAPAHLNGDSFRALVVFPETGFVVPVRGGRVLDPVPEDREEELARLEARCVVAFDLDDEDSAAVAGRLAARLGLAPPAELRSLHYLVRPEVPDAAILERLVGGEETGDPRRTARALARLLVELRGEAARDPPEMRRRLVQTLQVTEHPSAPLLERLPPAEPAALAEKENEAGPPGPGPGTALPEGAGDEAVLAVFEEGGLLSRALEGYRVRHAQVAMARAVAAALEGRKVLAVEAGTGVGKSFAYLVPLLLRCREEGALGVVATRTKNLQAQLFERDLPFLLRALGLEAVSTLVKGRGDYICLRRLEIAVRDAADSLYADERLAALLLERFAARSRDGDLERLPGGAFSRFPALRRLVERVRCEHGPSGRKCPYGARCFYPRLLRRVQRSDLLVANHALLLQWPRSFPSAEHVVIDEAHDLVDSASDAFGVDLSMPALQRILGRVVGPRRDAGLPRARAALERAGEAEADLLAALDAAEERARGAVALLEDLARALDALRVEGDRPAPALVLDAEARRREETRALLTAAARVAGELRVLGEELMAVAGEVPAAADGASRAQSDFRLECEAAADQAAGAAEGLDVVVGGPDTHVVWVEWREGGARLRAAPIDVAPWLERSLLSAPCSVVLTSATLRVSGSFDFLSRQLGLDRLESERVAEPLALGSPFRYEEALDLFVPVIDGDPLASDPEEAARAVAQVAGPIARLLGGRTLVLFHSLDRMERAARLLREELSGCGVRVLVPGVDGSAARVLERFRIEPRAILLGARSFWEGVDVPGPKVTCAVIERIPFEAPDEPVHRARTRHLEENGQSGFLGYTLPRAVLRLRQGIGRVVRGESDRGVVLLLDRRVFRRRYGPLVLRSLPVPAREAPLERILARVRERFGGGAGAPSERAADPN